MVRGVDFGEGAGVLSVHCFPLSESEADSCMLMVHTGHIGNRLYRTHG